VKTSVSFAEKSNKRLFSNVAIGTVGNRVIPKPMLGSQKGREPFDNCSFIKTSRGSIKFIASLKKRKWISAAL
jgi:hypothetical protein